MSAVLRGLVAIVIMAMATNAHAVILYSKSQRNTVAPKRSLANSGWQWQGQWGDFLGTAISRRFFATAEHVGGQVGDPFVLNGVTYTTVATYDDPNSDLQLWRVDRDFPSWAPLFKDSTEADRGCMIFGRGTQRGDEVSVNGELKGWLWGEMDFVQSWGKNVIVGAASTTADPEAGGHKIAGGRIYFKFDRQGVSYEGMVSAGDSGGGLFVKAGKVWKLAGVNHSAEATFSYPGSSDIHKAALFDVGGLMAGDQLIADTPADNPARGFATRISARISWIFDVVSAKTPPSAGATPGPGVPEPATLWIVLPITFLLRRPRGWRPARRGRSHMLAGDFSAPTIHDGG